MFSQEATDAVVVIIAIGICVVLVMVPLLLLSGRC